MIHDASDLYSLAEQQIGALPGFKEKSTQNLLDSLQESKRQPFTRVVFALGIRHVGESVAELLVERFRTIEALSNADLEAIAMVSGIGPEIAGSVRAYLDEPSNLLFIERLREAGLRFQTSEAAPADLPLQGMTFVITGTLAGLSRLEAKEAIQRRGGKVTAAVSSVTNYVVVGEKPGSKAENAQELGVETIDEAGLRDLLQGDAARESEAVEQ